MTKKQIEIALLIAFIVILFLPFWDLEFRYAYGYGENGSGLFQGLWAEITNDYDYLTIYGFNAKFPFVYTAILVQCMMLYFKKTAIKFAIWLYVLLILVYGISLGLFMLSFDHHITHLTIGVGSYLFFAVLITGIIKSTYHTKPEKIDKK